MKKWVQIVLPVMLFATVLYFCVFAVVFYQSEQTAALLGSGTTVVLDAGHGGEDGCGCATCCGSAACRSR